MRTELENYMLGGFLFQVVKRSNENFCIKNLNEFKAIENFYGERMVVQDVVGNIAFSIDGIPFNVVARADLFFIEDRSSDFEVYIMGNVSPNFTLRLNDIYNESLDKHKVCHLKPKELGRFIIKNFDVLNQEYLDDSDFEFSYNGGYDFIYSVPLLRFLELKF